ncbi:Uncharacterized protein FWK35_00020905 [Aphis craccivora]|uniref:Uncharacterized protein n=1 Tax=Aphis craccivora TaxID=307492 RepID=A0A6G0YGI1_APHCR|nr:Uncharacterized protein FWK35_00020905 [Aphis craccivora]
MCSRNLIYGVLNVNFLVRKSFKTLHYDFEVVFGDSERSDKCIYNDVRFLVSVYSITCRNNASISNFRRGFRCQSEYPWCIIQVKIKHIPTLFKKIVKNNKKVTEKLEFLHETMYSL